MVGQAVARCGLPLRLSRGRRRRTQPAAFPLTFTLRPSHNLPALPCLQPLLENLLDEFTERYPGIVFPPVPRKGELDLDVLREATYFFS